jgi:hypothetical protein
MTEPTWQKSTYSEEASSCVEISRAPTTIHIRDSKNPTGPHLALGRSAWGDFVSYAARVGG